MARGGPAWIAFAALLALASAAAAQQMADPDFRPTVARPAFVGQGPVVLIDEAHQNFHTADGRYEPFARLLRADGFDVRPSRALLTEAALKGARVLVIANAGERHQGAAADPSAFTAEEAAALRRWVEGGGSLLLIADHAPFGAAAASLARAFGVGMGQGWVYEPRGPTVTSQLDFSRAAGGLADHPVTRGRDGTEAVQTIRAFTGQSLTVPPGATNLMILSAQAREAADTKALNAAATGRTSAPRANASQGLAMTLGRGRVVVLGEAAMLSAQVVKFPDGRPTFAVGMNVPGYDNQQFALNLMRWLSGALD